MSFKFDFRQPPEHPESVTLSPGAQRLAMQLLHAIYHKTGGLNRAVRDVAELESGLNADESRAAWHDLLGQGLIQRFSQQYAARLTPKGIEALENAAPPEPMIEEPPVEPLAAPLAGQPPRGLPVSPKIFIVRGSDGGARETVTRFIEEIDLQAVPVCEQAGGRSVMEQIESHGEGGFAILLLSPEDLGLTSGSAPELRPTMNVLMELGYFIGRFGRSKICAFAVSRALGLPVDVAGVRLESFDESGSWRSALIRELKAAGYRLRP